MSKEELQEQDEYNIKHSWEYSQSLLQSTACLLRQAQHLHSPRLILSCTVGTVFTTSSDTVSRRWQCSRFVQHTLSRLCGVCFATVSFLLPAGCCEMAFSLQGGRAPLSAVCAPSLHVIIWVLAYSESLYFTGFSLSCLFFLSPRDCVFLWVQNCLIPLSTMVVRFLFKKCSWSGDVFCVIFQKTVFLCFDSLMDGRGLGSKFARCAKLCHFLL